MVKGNKPTDDDRDRIVKMTPRKSGAPPVGLRRLSGLVHYQNALEEMDRAVAALIAGSGEETLLFLEHPPLYTKGSSARDEDLLEVRRLPVYETGRGGEFTYHGPGQRVVYVMLDLNTRQRDVRAYVRALEGWVIDALGLLGVRGERRQGRVGTWVARPDKAPGVEDKISAIGIRMRQWVTYHGISINVDPDLSHYRGIVPCGICEHGVTSLKDLGVAADMQSLDDALVETFPYYFGALRA